MKLKPLIVCVHDVVLASQWGHAFTKSINSNVEFSQWVVCGANVGGGQKVDFHMKMLVS